MRLRGDILLIGYGNPGRLDDGLGPACASIVEELAWEHVTVESCYQLAVEHAEMAARFDVVIFVDAALTGPEPFLFQRLEPTLDATFSTHRILPDAVLGLAHDIFQASTVGYILGIRGYEFDDFGERISTQARSNLDAAVQFLETTLQPTGSEVC